MGMHVKPFLFESTHLIRVVDQNDDPWFVAKDACAVLGLKNPRQAVAKLDADEKDDVHLMDAIGREQATTIISEPGFYRLCGSSRKPEARRLSRWVYHDVLPSIRKTGSYHLGEASPVVESRAFPDWSLEEMRAKRGVVDMYARIWGVMPAQWIAPQLGFPVPPVELVEHGRQLTMMFTAQVEGAA